MYCESDVQLYGLLMTSFMSHSLFRRRLHGEGERGKRVVDTKRK